MLALGGLAAPAVIYLAINAGNPAGGARSSPPTTAFTLGVLAGGPSTSAGLRTFLLALSVVVDVVALTIAIFYSGHLAVAALLVARSDRHHRGVHPPADLARDGVPACSRPARGRRRAASCPTAGWPK